MLAGKLGLSALTAAAAAATAVQTPANTPADAMCSVPAFPGSCQDYIPVAFHQAEARFSFPPGSLTAPELDPAASCSQASPGNPSPGAGGAGKDARCKSAQGSQPPSALTQVPKAARAAKDLEGLGRPGKTGIQGVLSPAQLSARLLRWEGEQRGRTAGLRGAHLNQIMFSEAFSQETTQG